MPVNSLQALTDLGCLHSAWRVETAAFGDSDVLCDTSKAPGRSPGAHTDAPGAVQTVWAEQAVQHQHSTDKVVLHLREDRRRRFDRQDRVRQVGTKSDRREPTGQVGAIPTRRADPTTSVPARGAVWHAPRTLPDMTMAIGR